MNDEIADALVGFEADDQRAIDDVMLELDGTDNKGALALTPSWACPWPAPRPLPSPPVFRCTSMLAA